MSRVKAAQSIREQPQIPEPMRGHQHLVVPAKAGTHTPCRRRQNGAASASLHTKARGYGSPPSRGRLAERSGCNPAAFRLLDTALSRGITAMTIELHTWNTPNGRKISVALEEMGMPYKVIPVDITKGEQMKPEFLAISPNNKIPAIVDPDGPGGKRVSVFESGAILLYLGEKTGKFLP